MHMWQLASEFGNTDNEPYDGSIWSFELSRADRAARTWGMWNSLLMFRGMTDMMKKEPRLEFPRGLYRHSSQKCHVIKSIRIEKK